MDALRVIAGAFWRKVAVVGRELARRIWLEKRRVKRKHRRVWSA
jgi:hypothetical protein